MKTELSVRAVHQDGMRVYASDMDYPTQENEITSGPTPLTMLLASLAAAV